MSAISIHENTVMTQMAVGTFEVKINPLPQCNTTKGAKLARLSIDALIGLAGTMCIVITAGKHSYEFECCLPGD
jgi:hypothetical protein